MSLFDCPNELLEQIIREVTNDDLESLASACKLMRSLAGPMLKEHYNLKRKYDYKINYPSKRALHPAEILEAVIKIPRAISYIKRLSLSYRANSKQPDRSSALLERYDYFWDLLVQNPFIPDREVPTWYGRIKEGHLDGIFGLLLYYLPNLQEIRIQRPIHLPLTFLMVSRLKHCVGRKALREHSPDAFGYELEHRSVRDSEIGLEKLQRVIIDPATNTDEAHLRNRLGDFARFASFSSFPELQHLNGISLCSRKYNLDQNFSGFPNLRSIRLINCNVAPESFHSLLAGIKCLESFHYSPTADVKDVTSVVDDLKKYAGHSLSRLYLRHSNIETRQEAWKYRGFEQLKRIDLDWQCLVHYEEAVLASSSTSQITGIPSTAVPPPSPKKSSKQNQKLHHPSLVDLMPPSIESIKVVDLDGNANLEAIRWLFFKLSMRVGRFPNLKIIIFVTPRRDCWMHAKDICSRAGLKFPAYSCEKERRISGLDFVYE